MLNNPVLLIPLHLLNSEYSRQIFYPYTLKSRLRLCKLVRFFKGWLIFIKSASVIFLHLRMISQMRDHLRFYQRRPRWRCCKEVKVLKVRLNRPASMFLSWSQLSPINWKKKSSWSFTIQNWGSQYLNRPFLQNTCRDLPRLLRWFYHSFRALSIFIIIIKLLTFQNPNESFVKRSVLESFDPISPILHLLSSDIYSWFNQLIPNPMFYTWNLNFKVFKSFIVFNIRPNLGIPSSVIQLHLSIPLQKGVLHWTLYRLKSILRYLNDLQALRARIKTTIPVSVSQPSLSQKFKIPHFIFSLYLSIIKVTFSKHGSVFRAWLI